MTMDTTNISVLPRQQIDKDYTWNAESVFADLKAWEAERAAVESELPKLSAYQGRLDESPQTLAEAMKLYEILIGRAFKVAFYAMMSFSCETTNQTYGAMVGQSQGLMGKAIAAGAFIEPQLIAIGHESLLAWLDQNADLTVYRQYLDDLFRKQAYVRSAEVEEILGLLQDPFSGASGAAEMLTNADMQFPDAVGADGETFPLTQGSIDTILEQPDREARRTGWEQYADEYLAHKNTLAALLTTEIKQFTFTNKVRGYGSNLEAALSGNNIPTEVFYNLIDTYKANLPTWHRYWAIRRKALRVEKLNPYDIWAPLTDKKFHVPYQQSVDWISAGLAPLGDEYVNALRRGCLEDRWVDIYPNQGKRAGAFSYGTYHTHPFIMMSYDNSLSAMSTLAHELGHSMHSYLTRKNQPFAYGNYSLFLAEIASNFNQAMTRAYLFEENSDPYFQIALIEEAMNNFHRYFFIMPTLARFELELHERTWRGEGIAADQMNELMADLFSEGYGGEMEVDRARVGITWAQFGHLFMPFYVFQYATGISAAHHFAGRILGGEAGAAEKYLSFLSAGSSRYALDILDGIGADMRSPEIVKTTFRVLSDYVDRLEKLIEQVS